MNYIHQFVKFNKIYDTIFKKQKPRMSVNGLCVCYTLLRFHFGMLWLYHTGNFVQIYHFDAECAISKFCYWFWSGFFLYSFQKHTYFGDRFIESDEFVQLSLRSEA